MPKESVLIAPAFLDRDTCERIREAMDAGDAEPAEILEEQIALAPDHRCAAHVEVDAATLDLVERLLDAARPRIEAHFGVSLGDREGPSLLRYEQGGFFGPHRDRGTVPSWPAAARRRVSIVVFLSSSSEVESSGTFEGGTLRFHPDDAARLPDVPARARTLVAFPADLIHEVTPVARGVRDVIVDWFY
jgi:predicted 2-oxoglutarate/Fe(II)-dependent dioxygenase YbiX